MSYIELYRCTCDYKNACIENAVILCQIAIFIFSINMHCTHAQLQPSIKILFALLKILSSSISLVFGIDQLLKAAVFLLPENNDNVYVLHELRLTHNLMNHVFQFFTHPGSRSMSFVFTM